MKGTNAVSVGDDRSDQQPETMTLEKLRCRFGINYIFFSVQKTALVSVPILHKHFLTISMSNANIYGTPL